MKSMLSWLGFGLRVVLAVVFILAAVGKLRSGVMGDAPQTVYDAWLGVGTVWHYLFIGFEFLLAAWLLSGLWPRWSSGAAAVVLVAFSIVIAVEMRRSAPRPCGCLGGGVVEQLMPDDIHAALRQSLVMNGVLVLAAVWLVAISPAGIGLRGGDQSPDGSA